MMNYFNEKALLQIIDDSCKEFGLIPRNKYDDMYLNLASSIFLSIKKFQKETELNSAIDNLEFIFNHSTKGMTKNQIYNEHCSKMINAIVKLLKEGKIDYERYN